MNAGHCGASLSKLDVMHMKAYAFMFSISNATTPQRDHTHSSIDMHGFDQHVLALISILANAAIVILI